MNLKKRKHFTPKIEDSFLLTLFISSCFSFQTRTALVLVKFYCNAAVRRLLKTFRKFPGKRLWWKPFLEKFKLFKMDSGKGVFLSVFRTPFYGCFQTSNRNAFLWMITLFDANTPESEVLKRKTFLFSLRAYCRYFLKCILLKKNPWNLKSFVVKISPLRIS